MLKLSIVLPIYNECHTVRAVITELIQVLKEEGLAFEIIAVEDGSDDTSSEVIQALCNEFPNALRVITHPYNRGNGAAIKTGIRAAVGEVIACMDADGQHDPRELCKMLPYMTEYDLVVGARTSYYQGLWHRTISNKFYNVLASWLAEFPIQDLTSGYRLFRAAVVKKYVHLFPEHFSYPTTSTLVFLKCGYTLKYLPIHVRPRQGGTSHIRTVSDGWRFLTIIFKIIVLFEPLRLFSPIAMFCFLLALLATAYNFWLTQVFRITNTGVVLFVLGVLVLLLGFISEQIATIQVSLHDDHDAHR